MKEAWWTGLLLLLSGALAAPGLPQEGSLDAAERVTTSLDDAELADVLKSFALQYRLNIVAGAGVSGKVTMNLFDVPVEEALAAILSASGYSLRQSGEFYIVEPLPAKKEEAAQREPLEVAVIWLDYLTAAEGLKLIEPLKSNDGVFTAGTASEQGIPSNPTDAGGNSPAAGEVLVLKDLPAVLAQARTVLAELDRRPRQVLVEATLLEVKLDDETKFGIDLNTLSGLNFADLSGTSNLNSLALSPANPAQVDSGFTSASTHGFASDANSDGLHIGLVAGNVALFIEALEKVTDTTILANPRVLAVDRQPAEIIIGAKLGYLTTTTTETATVQEVEFLDTGTQLRFRPYIAGDGFVRLEIHPENSTGVVDPASGLPSETTTEVTTNVLIRDGNTIAIGGLIGEQVESVIKQVPLLGSIPYLGVLFRQTSEKIARREVIVLLTPHIVDGGEEDVAGVLQADALATARDAVFLRHLPISRSRLAAPWIERAEQALAEGDAAEAARCAAAALDFLPADVRAGKIRLRALAALGIVEEEVRALEALEGLR
ncbi:MAG: hypothetical protein HY812_15755 [Planctomycetes bacterium]|nr:hypothetical protein [Planctomycetota bacterium]